MHQATTPNDGATKHEKPRRTRSGGYGQNWAAYNKAQQRERDEFWRLLFELCRGVETPRPETGRPWLPWPDLVFAAVTRGYLGVSGRRLECHLKEAHKRGLLTKTHHFNTLLRFLRSEELTPCLERLVRETALPLQGIERFFAADSTWLGTPVKRTYYNRHQERVQTKRKSVKLHAICGTITNVITCVVVSDSDAADSRFFKDLLADTALDFTVAEVSADAGYLAAQNQLAALRLGAVPYIAFRSNSTADGAPKSTFWKKMVRLFHERRPEFTEHYYKRNNVETTFFMIKSKFGDRLRSKTDRAQINEALCLVVCHNLCVLVQSIYELGISPTFWTPVTPPARPESPAEVPARLAAVMDHLPGEQGDARDAPGPDRPTCRQMPLFGPEGPSEVEE